MQHTVLLLLAAQLLHCNLQLLLYIMELLWAGQGKVAHQLRLGEQLHRKHEAPAPPSTGRLDRKQMLLVRSPCGLCPSGAL